MNENFVSIKVDREERPDLDDSYQKVCQMSTGQGGWPLSVFLTPDQRPFYVGTYFPFLNVLCKILFFSKLLSKKSIDFFAMSKYFELLVIR